MPESNYVCLLARDMVSCGYFPISKVVAAVTRSAAIIARVIVDYGDIPVPMVTATLERLGAASSPGT